MSPKQARTTGHAAFSCHSDTAQAVFLAASLDDGHCTASLKLVSGRYEYKFGVDGDCCCEPGCTVPTVDCSHCIMNDFGTMNRVLAVP